MIFLSQSNLQSERVRFQIDWSQFSNIHINCYFSWATIIRNRANVLVIAIPIRKQFIFDEFGDFPVSMTIFKTTSSAAAATSLRKECKDTQNQEERCNFIGQHVVLKCFPM